jgi:hypothetical protein
MPLATGGSVPWRRRHVGRSDHWTRARLMPIANGTKGSSFATLVLRARTTSSSRSPTTARGQPDQRGYRSDELIYSSGESVRGARVSAPSRAYSDPQPEGSARCATSSSKDNKNSLTRGRETVENLRGLTTSRAAPRPTPPATAQLGTPACRACVVPLCCTPRRRLATPGYIKPKFRRLAKCGVSGASGIFGSCSDTARVRTLGSPKCHGCGTNIYTNPVYTEPIRKRGSHL